MVVLSGMGRIAGGYLQQKMQCRKYLTKKVAKIAQPPSRGSPPSRNFCYSKQAPKPSRPSFAGGGGKPPHKAPKNPKSWAAAQFYNLYRGYRGL